VRIRRNGAKGQIHVRDDFDDGQGVCAVPNGRGQIEGEAPKRNREGGGHVVRRVGGPVDADGLGPGDIHPQRAADRRPSQGRGVRIDPEIAGRPGRAVRRGPGWGRGERQGGNQKESDGRGQNPQARVHPIHRDREQPRGL